MDESETNGRMQSSLLVCLHMDYKKTVLKTLLHSSIVDLDQNNVSPSLHDTLRMKWEPTKIHSSKKINTHRKQMKIPPHSPLLLPYHIYVMYKHKMITRHCRGEFCVWKFSLFSHEQINTKTH